jgi:hypothetical protein
MMGRFGGSGSARNAGPRGVRDVSTKKPRGRLEPGGRRPSIPDLESDKAESISAVQEYVLTSGGYGIEGVCTKEDDSVGITVTYA